MCGCPPRLRLAPEVLKQAADEPGALALDSSSESAPVRVTEHVRVARVGNIQMRVGVVVHVHRTAAPAGFFPAGRGIVSGMSLRGEPVEEQALLPDGRAVRVRIAVPQDPYIRRRELQTVTVELWNANQVLATVSSLLAPHHTSEARQLAREIVAGLEAGELEPTAGAIEPLAERIP